MTDTMTSELERIYRLYNKRQFVRPDPLEFLYLYEDPADREIVGVVASCLAYGRVLQIKKSIQCILEKMTPSPFRFIRDVSPVSLKRILSGFRHRFTTGDDLTALLLGVQNAIVRHGSLQSCLTRYLVKDTESLTEPLSSFVEELSTNFPGGKNSLFPSPSRGSACKRLNLYLRWMVRSDDVDPGGWDNIPASKLIVPLDTHMHRVCLKLGLTKRRQANMKTALEITEAFRRMVPDDPVRYDFILTRPGIWENAGIDFPGKNNLPQQRKDTLT